MQTATPTTPIVTREGLSANVGSLWPGGRIGITHGHATARRQTNLVTLLALSYPHGHGRGAEGPLVAHWITTGNRERAHWPLHDRGNNRAVRRALPGRLAKESRVEH